MVSLHRFDSLETGTGPDAAGPMASFSEFSGPQIHIDRFAAGSRIVDALGVDTSLDSAILELDDLFN